MYTAIHQIPLLDLTELAFDHQDPPSIQRYLDYQPNPALLTAVSDGLREGDFFQIFGTSIPAALPRARRAALQLFSHPSEVLEANYGHPDRFRQRGYSPFGGEKAVGMSEEDTHRQFWMTGHMDERELGQYEDRQFDSIDRDPDDLSPEFGSSVRRILREAVHVSRVLLRCFEVLFNRQPGELINTTTGADTVTRTLYYTSPKLNAVLAAEHEDINMITVLSGDMWGLEVLIDGAFHPVLIRPDCVLVNLGEMLNQLEGCEHLGRIRHRVVARPGVHDPRIQFATFVHLLRDTVLKGGVRCGDWFAQRIREIQAK